MPGASAAPLPVQSRREFCAHALKAVMPLLAAGAASSGCARSEMKITPAARGALTAFQREMRALNTSLTTAEVTATPSREEIRTRLETAKTNFVDFLQTASVDRTSTDYQNELTQVLATRELRTGPWSMSGALERCLKLADAALTDASAGRQIQLRHLALIEVEFNEIAAKGLVTPIE